MEGDLFWHTGGH